MQDYAKNRGYEITDFGDNKEYIRFISTTSLAKKVIMGSDLTSAISISNNKRRQTLKLKVKATGNSISNVKIEYLTNEIADFIEKTINADTIINSPSLETSLVIVNSKNRNKTKKKEVKDNNYFRDLKINGYSNKIAVVIGINDYYKLPKLDGAVPDAKRMSNLFKELGFNKVIEILDKNATRVGILDELGYKLKKELTKDDLLVIYFAGHGETEYYKDSSKHGYIIPVDSDPNTIFSTAISMEKLRTVSVRLPAKHIYYIMDSCYSGIGLKRSRAVKKVDYKFIKKMISIPVVQMITAGSEGEEAYEVDGRGLFTDFIIRGIKGEADFNHDGVVTSSELGNFIRPEVTSASNATQTPQFGTLSGYGEIGFFY